MTKAYFPISIVLSIFIFSACGPGSLPLSNNPSYQLSIVVDPAEGGSVLPESKEVSNGDEIVISASPNEGWLFDSWRGDHTGSSNPDTVIADSDMEISALFLKRDYPLTIAIAGSGSVSEKIIQPKATDYPHGTTVELTAEPSDGWSFVEWGGDQTSGENPIQIEINDETEITAHFEKVFYSLVVEVEGSGSVDKFLQTGNVSEELFEFDSVIELTASAAVGWGFLGWEGDRQGDLNPITIRIDSDKVVRAVFVQSNIDFAGGSGTEMDPYRISTIDHLQNIDDEKYIDKHFVQINNVNAASTSNWNRGKGFKPIGNESSPFRGTYDGGGFIISRLTINREDEDFVGLFGYVVNGVIKNTGLRNITIYGDEIVGGLVGNNNGEVIRSYVEGSIFGEEEVGGLVGRNNGQISDSYASVEVVGEDEIGGLVGVNLRNISGSYAEGSVLSDDDRIGGLAGYNRGSNINSYSHSEVTGDEDVGGLVGENQSSGTVEYSYATGRVRGDDQLGGLIGMNRGSIKDSYWDTDGTGRSSATGRGSSRGSTGLGTSELEGSSAINNMPEFDWNEIWRAASDYPILRWQER